MSFGNWEAGFFRGLYLRSIVSWIFLGLFCFAFQAVGQPVPDFVPGRVLVKPKAGVSAKQLRSLLGQHGAVHESSIPQINVHLLRVTPGAEQKVAEALSHHPSFEFASVDRKYEPELVPNDYYYSCCAWHLPKMQCPQAWDITTGQASVVIAILDTGVQLDHPDLIANLVAGWNFYDNNSDASDVLGHGTQVAGAAAAVSNNGTGVASVAWNCKIMPLRVSDTTGSAYESTIAQALTWAADHGARVANISYAVSQSTTVTSSAQYFQSKGGVVTVAAGNQGVFVTASDNPYVLTVSATDSTDTIESWSNTGNDIDLAAPNGIPTTDIGGKYATGGGTSISAPIVAGVAALVVSVAPQLSGSQIAQVLKNSADDLGAAGWDPQYGYGRVNAYKAVLAATGGATAPSDTTPPVASITSPSNGATVAGTVSVSVSASDNVGVTKVELYVDTTLVASSSSASATFSWNSTSLGNGSHSLVAKAYDAAGNSGSSATVSVTVSNGDTTPPTVSITAPLNGATVSGTINIAVAGSDNVGVTKLELYLDGALVGTSSTASTSFSWTTTSALDGGHTVQAKAYDAAGNVGTSSLVSVTVSNGAADTIAPTVQITSPANGASVSKTVKINVNATDNVGVTQVQLYIDGVLFGTDTATPYTFSWNTSKIARGNHTLQAYASDAAGNVGSSAIVTVTK